MFEFLNNNELIICPNSIKIEILKYLENNKKILNIKFMSIDEYKKHLLFDYDEKTIHYLVNKGIKVSNAITLINNLYFIENKKYNNEKLDYLVGIKKELDDNNLLIYDNLFKRILDRYNIIIYGYGKLDKWTKNLLKNAQIIDYEVNDRKYDVYHIETINDEVEFVFQKIIDLLNNHVDINKISLMNIDNEYLSILKRFSILYGIPICIDNSEVLMGTVLGKEFYKLISNNKNIDEIYDELSKYCNNKDYNKIINILSKYIEFNISDIKEEIKYELENTRISSENYENTIKIKNLFDYIGPDEYVFLMNFNNPSIPKISLDTDYITDNIKDLVGLDKIEIINKISKENTLNYLSSIDNLIISYKDSSAFNNYYPSILLDDMSYELKEYKRSMNYSDAANKRFYTIYLDDYAKYGVRNENLDLLYTKYDKNNYLSYTNQFTGINKDELVKYLNNELVLSYSSIDNFYKCGFKYYLTNILKVNLFEETFMTIIGNLFHDVLRHINDDDFDFDKSYQQFLKEYTFNNKEQFFLDKLKKDLLIVIEVIKKHQFITGFNKMLYEEKIDITIKNNPYVHFKGFVDKIMYKEKDNETLVSIIDYKTGNIDIKIKNLEFGLSMQLPIYLYLVSNSTKLKNIKFAGFYLQHILNNNLNKGKKSLREEKEDKMKLEGYSTDDINRLSIFDSTYESSEMIHGMKLNKDNTFNRYANVLSDGEINNIIKLTEEKINEAMEKILNGEFLINPKIIDNENVSCLYCKYQDICYHKEDNNVYLRREENDAKLDEETNTSDL